MLRSGIAQLLTLNDSSPTSSGPDTSPGSRQADHHSPFFLADRESRPRPQPASVANQYTVQPSAERQSEDAESRHEGTLSLTRQRDLAQGMGKFTPSPLKVGHGVALLEESVELGVPDVVTHA